MNMRIGRPNTVLRIVIGLLVIGAYSLSKAQALRADGISVTGGQRVAFLGASVTHRGWSLPDGYIHLVVDGLAANGVRIVPIPAGIEGNTTSDMLARFQPDVLDQKPDWLVFCIGTNDVNSRLHGIALPQSEANIDSILDQCQKAGIRVMLMTTNTIGENLSNAKNLELAKYDAFLKQDAARRNLPIAEIKKGLADAIAQHAPDTDGHAVTQDGVHPNPLGHQIMATAVLRAFRLSDAQLATATKSWPPIPEPVAH